MSDVLQQFLDEYPVSVDIPVQWGEMDALQHVNNVTYFRYFESARIAYLMKTSLIGSGKSTVGPILADTECRYKRPVTFPDVVKVGCRITEYQEFGFLQSYAVYSTAQDAVTTQGSARIVLLDVTIGKKAALTDELKTELERIVRK
ncbi:MAG: acyl-CoA thioesterase [Natronospirillum sp.]